MKGDAQSLIKFFDGSDNRFVIPIYQRNYDWKEENCEQLFNEEDNVTEDGEHFTSRDYVRLFGQLAIEPIIGYELSFTKYFYKPVQLRTLDAIIEDIRAIERDTDGLLDEMIM